MEDIFLLEVFTKYAVFFSIILIPLGLYAVINHYRFNDIALFNEFVTKHFQIRRTRFPWIDKNQCPYCGGHIYGRRSTEGYFFDCANEECLYIKKLF